MSEITLGIIGGGQLGSMLAISAKKLNIKTVIYSDDPDAPAPKDDKLNAKKSAMEDEMEDIAKELDTVTDPDEKADLEDKYDELDKELKSINKKQYGENYERLFGPITEDWWSDMSSGEQAQYIKDHPNSKKAKNANS